MIRVALVSNVFEPSRHRREFLHEWREGITPREFVPADWPADQVVVFDGPRKVDLDKPLSDGATVVLAVAPGIDPLSAALFSALVFISLVLRSFLPKPPRARGDDSSASNGFSGIQSNRTEGEPIPVYYGRRLVGGQIISEFIENKGALGSFYNALLSLGEGPVYRVMARTTDTDPDAPLRIGDATNPIPRGWLYVNDGDAADIEDCEVHVRLGSLEQKAVPGFAFTTQTVTVDADIEGPEGDYSTFAQKTYGEAMFADANRNPVLASDGSTSSDVLWAEYGTSYSMTFDADEFSVQIEFPSGLGKTASDGFALPWYWALAVRYIELDGSGVAITTGGAESDGYARLPALPLNLARYAPGTRVDVRLPFYDPQTYTRPSFSRTLRVNPSGGANYANFIRNADFRPTRLSADETNLDSASFELWICLRPTDPAQPIDDNDVLTVSDLTEPATLFSWYSTSALRKGGLRLVVRRWTYTIAPGQTRQRIVPILTTFDTAGASTDHFEGKGQLGDATFQVPLTREKVNPISDWVHIAFTYKANAVGAQDRVRIYGNGELIYDELGTFNVGYPMTSASVGVEARMGRNVVGTDAFKGWMDNAVIWAGEMTADDVRQSYNGGLGRTLPAGDTTYTNPNGTVRIETQAVYTFDAATAPGDGVGGLEVVDDSTTYALDFVTSKDAGSPDNQIALGPLSDQNFIGVASTANERKRGRYRVEVMRGRKLLNGAVVQDEMRWVGLQLHTDALYTYPSSPLIGVRIRADGEINGRAPNLKPLVEGRLVPVWDGASTLTPTFNREWSRNPAWICLDAALDPYAGLGWLFQANDIDVESWQAFADFCDEVVYDQRGQRQVYPDWTDMLYSSVLLGTSPGIEVRVPTGTAPRHWVVGGYLGWYGLPAITAVGTWEDTNVSATGGGGYEIVSVVINPGGAGTDFYRVRWLGAAPWTNGALLSTQVTGSLTGTIEGREPRFQYDGAVDEAGSAWDFLVQTCASARAVPIRDGRKLRVHVEKPRPVRDIIGQGQVIPGSFEYEALSPKTRINAVEISFPDADQGYERSQALDEHPSIRGETALTQIRRRSYSLEGVTRRSQVLRHARFLLNREYLIRRKGRFRASVDMLGYEPGDVLQVAHDVADRGTSGRVLEYVSDTELKLDREILLESGKTYAVSIRYQSAPDGEEPQVLQVDEATTGLGAKKGWDGDVITFTTTMTREAQKGDAFIWYETSRELYVSIDSITLTRDLQREVSWTQYDEAIYDVEGLDDLADVDSEALVVTSEPGRGADSVPLPPDSVRVREVTTTTASGTTQHAVEVRWDRSTANVGVAGYDVFVGGRGGWEKAATVGAGADRAVIQIPGARLGLVVAVSVVARSPSGRSRGPDAGTRASVRMLSRPIAPASPLALYAAISADLAVYTWVPGSATETVAYELRRGGWILGQPVHLSGPGETSYGSSPSWATSAPLADGSRPAVPYYVRARARSGAISGAAKASWNPRATDYSAISDSYEQAFWSVSFEEFGNGWEWGDGTTPETTIADLAIDAGGWLKFDGSALTGTYTTPEPLLIAGVRSETVHLSAHVEGEQIHPLTWDDLPFTWGDATSCWTWEGPLDAIEDGEDAGRCTLSLEVRLKDEGGTWSNWQEYRPTRARCLSAQFRFTVTRPSTDFDVRIHRFSIDLQRVPRSRWERSNVQALAEGRVFRRG